MPTYRIYYAERDPNVAVPSARYRPDAYLGDTGGAPGETEWEEQVDARDEASALDAFFREHVRDNSELMWVDDSGQSRAVEGVGAYDADKTYIWIENGRLMEYQGLDEATAGKVSCPLCDGAGEVDPEIADEFLASYEQEEEGSWG